MMNYHIFKMINKLPYSTYNSHYLRSNDNDVHLLCPMPCLWRLVSGRSSKSNVSAFTHIFGLTEVDELHPEIRIDDEVGIFYVAVYNVLLVNVGHSCCHLQEVHQYCRLNMDSYFILICHLNNISFTQDTVCDGLKNPKLTMNKLHTVVTQCCTNEKRFKCNGKLSRLQY